MTRRLVRTAIQLGVVTIVALCLIVFLDNRYRVLPNAIHNHLPAHHPGLVVTDITIATCSSLNPFSRCTVDGPHWHRIEKDLYLGKSYVSSAYLCVERKKEDDLAASDELVFDIKMGRVAPALDPALSKDERWESRPAGLWIKKASKRHISDPAKVVTGVDVLFGSDAADPRSNWFLQDIPLFVDAGAGVPEPRLTVRKGPAIKVEKPVPRINKDGKFKILQAADLHLATGVGVCRHAMPPDSACVADTRTLDFLERIIEDEKPDFVVLSGDQVNGDTAPDAQSAIFKVAALLAKHKLPYAAIFGNHDDEGNLDRAQSMAVIDGLPYSLSAAGPEDVEGVGNYVVEILGRGSTSHSALTLYLLDTHSYSPEERQHPGYDWLKESQLSWFTSTAQGLKRKHKEYTHIHMDLAFIHIPLPEYRNPRQLGFVGNWTEPPTAPVVNTNFADALVEQGVVLVSCGHDHVNDYCLPHVPTPTGGAAAKGADKPKLWMCYGGGAGFGGYGGYYGYHRRMRLFEMDMNEGRIRTWKRLEHGTPQELERRWDEQIVVDGGNVVLGL